MENEMEQEYEDNKNDKIVDPSAILTKGKLSRKLKGISLQEKRDCGWISIKDKGKDQEAKQNKMKRISLQNKKK